MSLSGRFVVWLQRRQQRRNCTHTRTHMERWPDHAGGVYLGQGDYVLVTVCDDCKRAVKGAELAYRY